MKTIKICIFLLAAVLFFGTNSSAQSKIDGKWKEYWGVGEETDIDYNDLYRISTDNKNIKIVCESGNNYEFCDLKFKKKVLTFKMVNTTGNDTMPYKLKLSKDKKWLKGEAYSIKGKKVTVHWERLE